VYDLVSDVQNENLRKVKVRTIDNRTSIEGLDIRNNLENIEEFYSVLAHCLDNRRQQETRMNKRSSRSHALFEITLKLEFVNKKRATKKLCLVDLAGSERFQKAQTIGVNFKEGCKINQSLMTLRRCFTILKNGNKDKLPFMDSMLTRVLLNYLNSYFSVVMLTNIRQNKEDRGETIKVLEYASGSLGLDLPKQTLSTAGLLTFLEDRVKEKVEKKVEEFGNMVKFAKASFKVDLIGLKYELLQDREQAKKKEDKLFREMESKLRSLMKL
jgi:hypothetical protein